ncbi:ABC transporter permease [Rasiella sp. SM2506]|uniref:ABC transporter permease n=1 Tax=Rasiella sp. SM2506 TaxID=3423914 RepID=UPI003D79A492
MINIISLSIGLSAAFVIGMMVYYDFTFDEFHKDGDRIYRIVTDVETAEGLEKYDGVTTPLRLEVKENMTGIEQSAFFNIWWVNQSKTAISDQIYRDPEHIIFTNQDYFDMFSYQWLAGSNHDILNKPNEVILTEDRAKTYFPSLSPAAIVGKQIIYNETITAVVKGVVANLKGRTDLVFQEFVSLETAKQTEDGEQIFTESWGNTNSASQLFVKITDKTALTSINRQLKKLAVLHTDEYRIKFGQTRDFVLQPLSELHLNTDYGIYGYEEDQASKDILIGLALVGLFLLLLGSINFINLNTAQATQRAKEIGVRKTLGGSRRQLITQFLTETFVITGIAAIVSVVLSIWMLSVFDEFVPSGLTASMILQPQIIGLIVTIFIAVALLSGIYPSLVLSSFKPAKVLKGDQTISNKSSGMRKVLTVFQFSIAQIFIIATLLVGKQIYFLMHKDLGFKTDAIAYIETPWSDISADSRILLKTGIQGISKIGKVSLGGMPPASQNMATRRVVYNTDKTEIVKNVQVLNGDTNYLDIYNIPLLAGRTILNDTIDEYVINQASLSAFRFKSPEDAVDQYLQINGKEKLIVGVMADFNQRSLKTEIVPLMFTGDRGRSRRTNFRYAHILLAGSTANWKETLSDVEQEFKKVYPQNDFKVTFIDETIANFYTQEQRISTLLNWATGLSVLISCLGLLGLVIHTTERRTKEIGIRKVLGASLAELNVLLCKEFLVLVGLSFIIAVPLSYWGLRNWLQDFAYKTEMSWWVFILSGISMVFISLIIMSIRTMSTAMKNPVKSLKTE